MGTKLRLVFSITIVFLSFYASAQTGYWQKNPSQSKLSKNFSNRFDIEKGVIFSFDEELFRKELKKVSATGKTSQTVNFPNEKGDLITFRVTESPVFSKELSLKYPNIKSYSGFALDGSNDKIRFSVSHKGVQSMIVHSSEARTIFMQKDVNNSYVVYSRDPDVQRNADFICSTKASLENQAEFQTINPIDGQVLRKFRLAVSASGEYTEYHGGTVADALAAINATVTRVNEVFETDLAIHLELIANTDQIIFTDPATDPYSGNLSSNVQAELSSTIGAANYDIGILFNKAPADGNAGFIRAVCIDSRKGSAYASREVPEGDFFDLDFVAHEMGHQFGANHTWSFESEGTGVQVEPASGTTIMGYAGITGPNDVALNGDDYFHYVSILQISDYVKSISCGETINLTNNPPVVIPTGNFTIPVSTAFVLEGEATDLDVDDVLSYAWEQIDNGVVPRTAFGPQNLTGANFRSQKPTNNPARYFPKLSNLVSGGLTQTAPQVNTAWETVSDVQREMNFSFTVRDNAAGGGQVVTDLVNIFVENSAGPFVVTSQSTNEVFEAGTEEEITWDVANTEKLPINALAVDIFLSTDGGDTFPIKLAENTVNDGSQLVQLPGIATSEARIMVKASNNIFFAINASDFTIQESELVLNFETLEHEVCLPNVLTVPFVYETYSGFNEEATFSIANPPSGVDITISPETAISDGTSVNISFSNFQNIDIGTYPLQVVASTMSISKEVSFNLNVSDVSFSPTTLLTPMNGEINTSARTTFEWQPNTLATSYDIEISDVADFSSTIDTGTILGSSYSPLNLENGTIYYWRVRPTNSCGEGVFSAPFSFSTIEVSCQTNNAEGLPKPISASGPNEVLSEVLFLDDLIVADIKVNLELNHSYLSDLLVTLTSPNGTSVTLISSSCTDLKNINATFDDSANSFICGGNPAINGIVKPLGDLSSFKGESSLGEWVLTVSDNADGDGGALRSFSLEICAEGEFRPDADNDGVFDDGDDLCLGTPEGSLVDASGCEVLVVPSSNYTIEARSESCRSSNDGLIKIDVLSALSYTVTLSENGNLISSNDFTNSSFTFDNILAGRYSVCLTATDGTLTSSEQCFDVVVNEPAILSVSSNASLDGSFVDLVLDGASVYNIELNGITYQVEDSTASLDLKAGVNTLKVSTNLPCQGSHEEQFIFSDELLVYPNPFQNEISLFIGKAEGQAGIKVFNANGRFILSRTYTISSNELNLDFSTLATGVYYVLIETENSIRTTKIIKR